MLYREALHDSLHGVEHDLFGSESPSGHAALSCCCNGRPYDRSCHKDQGAERRDANVRSICRTPRQSDRSHARSAISTTSALGQQDPNVNEHLHGKGRGADDERVPDQISLFIPACAAYELQRLVGAQGRVEAGVGGLVPDMDTTADCMAPRGPLSARVGPNARVSSRPRQFARRPNQARCTAWRWPDSTSQPPA
jgi:hypothetical protein